jgi:hypothetical protein
MKSCLFLEDCARLVSFADIRFSIRFLGDGSLPRFRGATLRGAFGYSLKKTICHIPNTPCQECPVVNGCAYSCLFEGIAPSDRQIMRKYKYIPQPFVLVVNGEDPSDIKQGQLYEFTIRLFGQSINHLPYIVFAIMQAGEKGLGKDSIPFAVDKVIQIEPSGTEHVIYDKNSTNIKPGKAITLDPDHFSNTDDHRTLKIRFETPVKYRLAGEICVRPDFIPLLKAALRRIRLVTYFYGSDLADYCDPGHILDAGQSIQLHTDSTKMFQFNRYSNRQKQKVPLGGMIGEATYEGHFEDLLPILKLAELIHIGKATSFGFGRIRLQTLK